jgi:FkbM family methyltransferase
MNNEYIEITKFGKKVLFTSKLKDDYIFKTIEREKDFYEYELLDWLLVLPYDDGIFIDVGANLGNHTLFFSKIMGKECYSFEPNDKVYSALVDNITLNALEKNVKCFNTALGSQSGKASILSVLENNLGSTTLEYQDNGNIDVKTLDSMISKNQSVALIKIDVEGFEFEVLKGAEETIKTNTPILLIECADQLIIIQTIDYLNEFNYEPITVFGSTPLLVFAHSSKVDTTFGQNRPNFYSELKSYTVEHEKIDRINKRYRQLSESKDSIKADLDEARKKYRFSTEQISEYKIKVSDLQNDLKLLNSQIQLVNEEKERLSAEGDRVEASLKEEKESHKESQKKLEQYREEILSKEKELIRLENEYQKTIEQLNQANEQTSIATAEISTLQSSLEKLQEEKERLSAEGDRVEASLKEEKESHKESQKKLEQYREEILSKEKELIRLENEYQKTIEQLNQANEQTSIATAEISTLQSSLEKLQEEKERLSAEGDRVEASLKEEKESHKESQKKLDNANLKYRHQVNEVVPHLKNEIDRLKFQIKQTQANANHNAEQLKQKVAEAQQQVVKVRSTLSFQIGYQIVHGMQTWRGAIALPWRLWLTWQDYRSRNPQKPSFSDNTVNVQVAVHQETTTEAKVVGTPDSFVNKAVQELPKALKEMRIACIMDEFTFSSYAPECVLLQLTPTEWVSELEAFSPDILFIESAWRGKDDLWGSKVGHNALELQGIVQYCKQNQIPTLFWNKEDPVHFETFLNTAQQFDYVFTTDIDCIHRYKGALGHDRVYLLPFATQPKVHNPIEKYERKDAFCFAGAYYVRYPDRTKDLGNFVMHLSEKKPFEIYDRNYGKDDPNYMFPDEYKPFIVGTLAHYEIDKAYKGYNYAINLNSIKQSQTMFARRVFELLSSNTVTVSNFSRGVRLLFGDLVFTSDNSQELLKRLDKVTSDDLIHKKHRLAALRKVLKEHTYEDRLGYIVSKIVNRDIDRLLPTVSVLSHATDQETLTAIIEQFEAQSYEHKKLYAVVPDDLMGYEIINQDVILLAQSKLENSIIDECITEEWIACFSTNDYYGKNYLLDLTLSTRYSDVKVIGKGCFYSYGEDQCILNNDAFSYKNTTTLHARSGMIQKEAVAQENILNFVQNIDNRIFDHDEMLGIDEFNYCQDGGKANQTIISELVDDLRDINQGIELKDLLNRAEAIEPLRELEDKAPFLDTGVLNRVFKTPANKSVEISCDGTILGVQSHLADGKHEYIYAREDFTLAQLGYKEVIKFYLDTSLGLNIQLVVVFLDAQKQKISHLIKTANRNHEAAIPLGTEFIRFGLRVYAGGYADVKAIILGHRPTAPADVIGRGKHLVVTNNYPSYDDLYKNGFVHSRVKAYRENAIDVDIFKLRNGEEVQYDEFENIDVMSGDQLALDILLKSNHYESVLVHFLSPEMWEVLKNHLDHLKIIVWVHGAEIHPWYRRKYNLITKEDEESAKMQSEKRMAFWHSVLDDMPENLHLVFVSKSFSKEVFEDIGFELPKEKYSIIHNPIDTDMFTYTAKIAEQRKKILAIRPFASRQYANDLSVKAILELSQKPFFKELEFHIIGDGKLFDETLEPLRVFDNVIIERRFVTHSEIAALHKQYGIFLCPTRWDSQGVSRDEAMASGLVPVTNAVAAIPEFVDEECGVLAPAEDYLELAKGIERLYNDEKLFQKISFNAAQSVHTREKSLTAFQEILLLSGYETNNLMDLLSTPLSDLHKAQLYLMLSSKFEAENRLEEALISLERYKYLSKDQNDVLTKRIVELKNRLTVSENVLGIFDEHVNFTRRHEKYLDYPEYVQIETFAHCNAGCTFCPYSSIDRIKTKMSEELFNKIIEDLTAIPNEHKFTISLNHINEPLSDPRIENFIDSIQKKLSNADIHIISNGYLLNEQNIRMLSKYTSVKSVQISLNEIDADKHEENMNMKNKFDTIVANLDLLHSMKKNRVVQFDTVLRRVGDYSQHDHDFISYCIDRWPLFSSASRGLKQFMGKKDIKHLSRGINQVSDYDVPVVGCTQWYHLVIGSTGEIAMCCFDGNIDYPIGDVVSNSVLDIYNSKTYRKLRENLMTRYEASGPCQTCTIYWGKGNLSYDPQ